MELLLKRLTTQTLFALFVFNLMDTLMWLKIMIDLIIIKVHIVNMMELTGLTSVTAVAEVAAANTIVVA